MPIFSEALVLKCSVKMMFLKTLQNSQENTSTGDSFLKKFAVFQPTAFLKKRLWYKCISVNFEVFKNTYFVEHLQKTVFIPFYFVKGNQYCYCSCTNTGHKNFQK